MPESRRLITSRTGLRSAAVVAALLVAGCGGEAPWNEAERSKPAPAATTPATEPGPAAGDEDDAAEPAPAPTSTTPPRPAPAGGGTSKRPSGPPNPVAIRHDREALDVMRTMVSAIEGCRSGRERYADCDTHADLGEPDRLGAQIGRGVNEAQITAGTDGFRITVRSRSGAKFTVARGPSGERLKCVLGPDRGVCGADRRWSWTDAGA